MEEIWKDIKGYEGLYQVSNLGKVKSLERVQTLSNGHSRLKKEKIMSQKIHNGSPYYQVNLYDKNGKSKTKKIHWLVAETFIPNPNTFPIIHHIDLNKENNKVDNLKRENQIYAIKNGLKATGKRLPSSIPFFQYDLNMNFIKEWESINQCSKELNLSYDKLRYSLKNKKQYNGYIWIEKGKGE